MTVLHSSDSLVRMGEREAPKKPGWYRLYDEAEPTYWDESNWTDRKWGPSGWKSRQSPTDEAFILGEDDDFEWTNEDEVTEFVRNAYQTVDVEWDDKATLTTTRTRVAAAGDCARLVNLVNLPMFGGID